jgi:putative endonuclease
MTYQKSLGFIGEEIIALKLISQGYTIINRNYHSRYGEIDIIAAKSSELIVSEVKTRDTGNISGDYSLSIEKAVKVAKTFSSWLLDKGFKMPWNVKYVAYCINLKYSIDIQEYSFLS